MIKALFILTVVMVGLDLVALIVGGILTRRKP